MHRLIHSLLIFTFASIYPIHVAVGKEKPVTVASQIQQIEDRTAIRNVIDTFSNLADEKKIDEQLLLFTEDAIIDSHVKGVSVGVIQGRKAIGQAFTSYLSLFDVVYHINGQQTIDLQGDTAKTTSYCQVTLIGKEDGKDVKTTHGVIYHDEFVRKNGKWLISKRSSNFTWTEKTPFSQ